MLFTDQYEIVKVRFPTLCIYRLVTVTAIAGGCIKEGDSLAHVYDQRILLDLVVLGYICVSPTCWRKVISPQVENPIWDLPNSLRCCKHLLVYVFIVFLHN